MLAHFAKAVLISIATLLSAAVALAIWFVWFGDSGCANTEKQRLPSPDGRREVVIFERDCGATTDYSTQVAVLARGAALPNRPANAFIYGHRMPLRVRWDGPQALTVAYPPGFRGHTEQRRAAGVEVRYVVEAGVWWP